MKLKHQVVINDIINGNSSIILKIRDEDGVTVGEMFPLTTDHLNEPEIIKLLTDWRNKNMECFLGQFVATPERTSSWMKHVLFKQNDQLLFLIKSDEKLVGHFGFKNLTANDVLLDNAISGERSGHPKLYTFAGKTLINWLAKTFSIGRVYGQVMADNVPAMMMNKQIGFEGWHKYPLQKKVTGNETVWTMGLKNDPSPDSKYCYEIEILIDTLVETDEPLH